MSGSVSHRTVSPIFVTAALLVCVAIYGMAIDVEGTLSGSAIVAPPPVAGQGTLGTLFFGDIMLERRLEEVIARHGVEWLFHGIRVLPNQVSLRDIDIVGANLEGAVTEGGVHSHPVYPYDFAFSPERVAAAVDVGISFFTIANNHLQDQGEEGVLSTRRLLTGLGVDFSGDVDSRVSDDSVTVIERNDLDVAMISLSGVYGALNTDAVRGLVSDSENRADLVIVNVHWGVEYQHVAHPAQRSLARALVESGTDLVIGHHPHVTQGIEIVDGVPVFYSLGNFIFDQAFSEATQEGLAVRVGIDAQRYAIDLLPFRSIEYQPRWRENADRTRALDDIASWSFVDEVVREDIRAGRLIIVR